MNLENSRANNSRILRIKNAKFSGYCFYMNTNIQGDFQICIRLPLRGHYSQKQSHIFFNIKNMFKNSCTNFLFIRSRTFFLIPFRSSRTFLKKQEIFSKNMLKHKKHVQKQLYKFSRLVHTFLKIFKAFQWL